MTFTANFIHRNGDTISSSYLVTSPLPIAEDEALWQAESVEANCGVHVQTIEIMHDGRLCSTLDYRE